MKAAFLRVGSVRGFLPALTLLLIGWTISASADQIDMKNGDRYSGKVVTLETNAVVLKSDMLGTLRIRRDQVASIHFGVAPVPASPAADPAVSAPRPGSGIPKAPPVPVVASGAGPSVDFNSSLGQQIAMNPALVNEVRQQVMAGAGPNALKKYDSLVGGISSGTLNVADLRKEAASVSSQLRQNRGSEDAETAAIFDEYLSILDDFLVQTPTALPSAPAKKGATSAKAK